MTLVTQTGHRPHRYAISIPAANGTIVTLRDLLIAGGMPDTLKVSAVKIHKKQPASATDRAAFIAASSRIGAPTYAATDFTTHGQYVAAGENYYEPSDNDAYSFVRSTDNNAVSALAIVYA